MQNQSNQRKRYIFQGDAVGPSGQITHPFQDVIPVQVGSVLSGDGGVGSARIEGFRYKEILSCGAAYTEVIGTEGHDGVFETMSLSVVEKFNILDVVTCDRMVARLTAQYKGEPKQDSSHAAESSKQEFKAPQEACVVPIGSYLERLRIGNVFFERLNLAPDFFCRPEHASWTGLQKALENETDRKALSPLSLPGPDGNPAPLLRGEKASGVLGFCIALGKPRAEDELGVPLRINIPQFGTVHLGEFFCYPDSRQLIMLRVELGCPVQGKVTGAGVKGGVGTYP